MKSFQNHTGDIVIRRVVSTILQFRILPAVILSTLILAFFNKMSLSNLILARGDTFLYFYPYWQAAADALKSGHIPLWNPNLFMGAPFLANSQAGFFYPLNWPVWLLFPTPYAASASILLHLFIAAMGTYVLGRYCFGLSRTAGLFSALLFGLGGYFTAQVEHINQLQGLSWLPWIFFSIANSKSPIRSNIFMRMAATAVFFSMQLLAGHSQTAFITGVGALIFLITHNQRGGLRNTGKKIFPIVGGFTLALLMTAVQLLPTLELAQLSSRQGGLSYNEVVSFSLHPFILGRSLLLGYDQSLFTEYVAMLPISALLMAFVGSWQAGRRDKVWSLIVLVIAGFMLALGRFAPVYWLLARVPGFDLFRAPARWLALFAFGVSLLAGIGLDAISHIESNPHKLWQQNLGKSLKWAFGGIAGLIGWAFLSVVLVRAVPIGSEVEAEWPSTISIIGWLVETFFLFLGLKITLNPKLNRYRTRAIVGLAIIFLFTGTRSMPYNNLTTPEAYFDLRPAILRLQTSASVPKARYLSLSDIFFDPGDQGELLSIYEDQLPAKSFFDYIVAIKLKEIVAPNLPMAYGLSSVDGFDGGILPTSSYSHLTQLILQNNKQSIDGRLREQLTAVPDARWLDLFNVGYIITDKTGDTWKTINGELDVYFDLQHPVTLLPGGEISAAFVPNFPSTGIAVLGGGDVGTIQIESAGIIKDISPVSIADDLVVARWPGEWVPDSVLLKGAESGIWQVQGISLFNDENMTFHSLVLGEYKLIHSGDVKIYQNLDVQPRAFLVSDWSWKPDVESSLQLMESPAFNPRKSAVLIGSGLPASGGTLENSRVEIETYQPEKISISVSTPQAAILILTDANYPGWDAQIDTVSVPIFPADVLFRAIMIPAGSHLVEIFFEPQSFVNGRWISLLGIFVWLASLYLAVRPRTKKE